MGQSAAAIKDCLLTLQRKPLVHLVCQKKPSPSTSKWPSSVGNSDAKKNIGSNALLYWNEYDTLTSKEPTKANVYAGAAVSN
jgi:hypothetical protein